MKSTLAWIAARAAEPSTWAGIAAAAQIAQHFAPELQGIMDSMTGVAAAAAVGLKDKGSN